MKLPIISNVNAAKKNLSPDAILKARRTTNLMVLFLLLYMWLHLMLLLYFAFLSWIVVGILTTILISTGRHLLILSVKFFFCVVLVSHCKININFYLFVFYFNSESFFSKAENFCPIITNNIIYYLLFLYFYFNFQL